MRQIVLDTETTGLSVEDGHRIIEIGCLEVVNRRITGNTLHFYVNPERAIDEGAMAVHGIGDRACLLPRLAGGNPMQRVELEYVQRRACQRKMRAVRRIEGAAEEAEAFQIPLHNHSRGFRKSLYNFASGVPGSGCQS